MLKKKIRTVLYISVILILFCPFARPDEAVLESEAINDLFLLIGSYATPEEEGINVYRFNEETGTSQYISGLKGISNPSYLTVSKNGDNIYVVSEEEEEISSVNSFYFDKQNGTLSFRNSQPTHGGAPCYITLDPTGQFVITANYIGGNITIVSLDKNGKLGEDSYVIPFSGKSVVSERQSQSHIHCIAFTPDQKFMLATDLGTDNIHLFPINKFSSDISPASFLMEEERNDVKVKSGSGPRHICFHPNHKYAYLINEISGEVTAFSYDKGRLDAIQYITADTLHAQGSADIHTSPDGKFLYASNRLKGDGIAIFAINGTDGMLSKVGYQPTSLYPRNFVITPNGNYLLVACRDTNLIQLFKINKETGLLTDTGKVIRTSKPVCLKFIF